jgi:POT family proton-dependent oligopeptide transporter
LISSLAWVCMAIHPSVLVGYITLGIIALGEIVQSPRYYEYISRLAPPGQQGTYMGFAFMPIGIGSLIGGKLGGKLLHEFAEVQHQPAMFWWSITGIGIVTTILLFIYDRLLSPTAAETVANV